MIRVPTRPARRQPLPARRRPWRAPLSSATATAREWQMGFSKLDLLRYMRSINLGVISTVSSQGTPEAALVGIATADDHRVIFDTTTATRKHANLMHSPAVALAIAGPGEKTLQSEGRATEVRTSGADGSDLREQDDSARPDGRDRLACAVLPYGCIEPA